MQRLRLILCFITAFAGFTLALATAGSYTLSDGREISGEPITIKDDGVKFKTAAGTYSDRITWDKFSQEGLKTLLSEARTANEKAIIEPLIEAPAPAKVKASSKDIPITPVTPPSRPKEHTGLFAMFSSPLGLFIFFILYGATLFAAYEVALFKNHKIQVVCALAAVPVIGILSPILFALIKPRVEVETASGPQPQGELLMATSELAAAPALGATTTSTLAAAQPTSVVTTVATAAPAAPNPNSGLPQPIVFKRPDFLFNRRFFETKLVNFQRLVPSGADKDMVVWIKAARGEFSGRRITQITPNDLHLQTFHGNATADETIPFVEIMEVQIRHKDYVV